MAVSEFLEENINISLSLQRSQFGFYNLPVVSLVDTRQAEKAVINANSYEHNAGTDWVQQPPAFHGLTVRFFSST